MAPKAPKALPAPQWVLDARRGNDWFGWKARREELERTYPRLAAFLVQNLAPGIDDWGLMVLDRMETVRRDWEDPPSAVRDDPATLCEFQKYLDRVTGDIPDSSDLNRALRIAFRVACTNNNMTFIGYTHHH